jgi:hypothetical protein
MNINKNIYFTSIIKACIMLLCFAFNLKSEAQNRAIVKGQVFDDKNKFLELVNVGVLNTSIGTVCNEKGYYELAVPSEENIILVFSRVGFEPQRYELKFQRGEVRTLNIVLKPKITTFQPVEIIEEKVTKEGMQKIDIKVVNFVPSAGGIEKLVLLTAPGVFSTSELSSTYSVRGGNYDENLVYVNDIEVYRPFLIRSGQQEGLSFLNSDLAGSVLFSSGGFDASYGDKTASVLDVHYRQPEKFAGTFSGGLLGGNLHLEGASKDTSFTYLTGIRYKTSRYLLSAMETKGNYQPNFGDFQAFLSYHFNKKTTLSWLGYISKNTYNLIPETRETSYGTINEAYRLTIYFSGEETDRFDLYKNAFILTHKPNDKTQLKFITAAFVSNEEETYDILGQYWIGRLETDFGKPGFGEVSEERGVGAFLNHSRNYLTASVINAEHRGKYFGRKWLYQWGIKVQHEQITDKINEWTYLDSSGFSLPHAGDSVGYVNPESQPYQYLYLHDTLRSSIELSSMRYSGFFMVSREFDLDTNKFILTAGVRSSYWDLNNQFLASPRASISFKPKKNRRITYRLAAGLYHQPPFYRELRNIDGSIMTDVKAQRSVHLVGGTDIDLIIWRRPFKFTTEVYYKHLDNLIPYIIDNVRIRYLPEMKSEGYATGIDLKINGEFVPDIESWVNFSIMQTRENIISDYYEVFYNTDGERIVPGYTFNDTVAYSEVVNPGYIPRPTDQRINFSLFFQDYLPNNSTFKMHLGIFFGTGLPFGAPNTEKHKHTLRMPSYRRVDVGFSKQLISEGGRRIQGFSRIQNAYISVEVFNLLQINNTISYIWIADVTGRQYAVPNYLTPRQLNVKLLVQF